MLTYCNRCVMPSSKPDLHIDPEGVCNACRAYEDRKNIDWNLRRKELIDILDRYRAKSKNNWDCIIPVSGGKDSTYQVIQVLNLGMNPLCVTASTCDLSEIGRKNIENLKHLGVDHIEMSPNPLVRSKLNKIGLMEVGDISWPEHVGIFTIPVRAAVQFKIPLIIWGENSQNEYGGPASASENNNLNRSWLEEFGGLLGLRVSDLIGRENLTEKDLIPYFYPEDQDLIDEGVTGLFLGYYLPWDGLSNFLIAQAYGFSTPGTATLGSMVNYENLDNYQTSIHEYFKYIKYGFGRTTDHVCLHIRRGRLSRDIGIEIVKRLDGKFPHEYLGKNLQQILEPLNITLDEFTKVCDKFTNKKFFKCDTNNNLIKDKYGNLQKINYDNL